MKIVRALAAGAAAGAAGTTALNTLTYLDMVWRARPASSTPEATIEKLADVSGVRIPGNEEERTNRIAGLGPLTGLVVGAGVGAVLGLAREAGYRPGLLGSSLTAAAGALIGSNGPMTVLGITDPRTWSPADWASDIIPHLAYGIVTGATLHALDPGTSRRL
ncbi:hypothetical protein [Pseudarthrobacter albicanus]|uniref:hypothetical protein n=1 Tax=Pseudarthrobacter albicanus TaxID=2823873 RepID=UPI001BAB8632|nr:hypothetical protein [Pseudarthrobacter albicanus]